MKKKMSGIIQEAKMVEELINLYKLQQIDSELSIIKNKIDKLPEKIAYEKRYFENEVILKKLDELEKSRHELSRKIKRDDEEVKTIEQKINKEEKRLFSGSITNPKELKSIQDEIAILNKKKDSFETDELELMENLDEMTNIINNFIEQSKNNEIDIKKLKEEFDGINSNLEMRLTELSKERESAIKVVSGGLLEKYTDMIKNKGGIAVARIIDGDCSGCRVKLPFEEIETLNLNKELGRCPSCKRMLIPESIF